MRLSSNDSMISHSSDLRFALIFYAMHKFTTITRKKKRNKAADPKRRIVPLVAKPHPLQAVAKKRAGSIGEETHHPLVFCSENGRGRRGWIGKREQRWDEPFAASAGDATAELRYHTIRVVPHRLQAKIHTEESAPWVIFLQFRYLYVNLQRHNMISKRIENNYKIKIIIYTCSGY